MKLFWSLFFILTIGFLACKPSKNLTVRQLTISDDVSNLQGEWRLVSWQTKGNTPFFDSNKTPSIRIDDEKITGFGGCNRFSALIRIDSNRLQINKIAATRMFCEGVPENDFFTLLREMNHFEVNDEELSLFGSESQNLIFILVE